MRAVPSHRTALSPELRVMFDPVSTYASLAAERTPASGRWAALRRPALVALVTGTAAAVASTGRVTFSLVVSCTICWSVVPLLQAATAAGTLRPAGAVRLGAAQRLDLWFVAHGPWSLWMLGASAAAAFAGTRPSEWIGIGSAIVPAIWTAWIALAFCRGVLDDAPAAAWRRVLRHEA